MSLHRHLTVSAVLVLGLATSAAAQVPDLKGTANPELVGQLAQALNATPKQAEGAAGSLFSVAKSRLSPADFGKVSKAVPGMAGLLKAAPALGGGSNSAIAQVAGTAGALGGLANAASAFSKLGLKPELVATAVPILTQFVSKSGGAAVGNILAGVLK